LLPRKAVARKPNEPTKSPAQRPLSKRWRKWYKRSWLSNPSTAGWQIAAGYAGIGVLILVALLCAWMRQLQSEATADPRAHYGTVYTESWSTVPRFVLTAVFSLGTLFCLPIPYLLWTGSNAGRWLWLLVRGFGYFGGLVILHLALSDFSAAVAFGLMMILVVVAASNLVGCILLTTSEGSVGRTLFAILLIVVSELAAIGVFLTAAQTFAESQSSAGLPNS